MQGFELWSSRAASVLDCLAVFPDPIPTYHLPHALLISDKTHYASYLCYLTSLWAVHSELSNCHTKSGPISSLHKKTEKEKKRWLSSAYRTVFITALSLRSITASPTTLHSSPTYLWLDSITKGSHPVFTHLSLYYFLSVPDQYLSFPPLKCIHFQGPVKYHFLYEAVTDFQQKISWQWLPLGCQSLLFILLHSSHYCTTPPYSVLCILLCSSPLLTTDRKGWFYLFLSLHSVFNAQQKPEKGSQK